MDELTASLATSFGVSSDPNSTDAEHPRFADYKRKDSNTDQEGRRTAILTNQKDRRFNSVNHLRRLVEDTWEDVDDLVADDDEEKMDTEASTKKHYRPGRYYRNQLMLSEWLVEVPCDFDDEWLMVMCPWGKRCLVVSAKGYTTAYNRGGYLMNSFPSHLPGGNRKQPGKFKDNAILDCIYHEVEKTYYVLDIMCWKDHPVYDSETDFRFFWMMSKMQEMPEIQSVGNVNPFKFIPLQYHACTKESLTAAFQTTESFDGCLFYHKRAHYLFGSNPLVVWLRPYMIPEMLGIEVPDKWMEQKPANYTTYQAHMDHIKETKEKYEKSKEKRVDDRKERKKLAAVRSREFKVDLMMSKWFLETPVNFETAWAAVVCPVGQRCLVMAVDGETKWFHKRGHKMPGYFLSYLPGGNMTECPGQCVTMLDCIFVEEMFTFFILDAIYWNNMDLRDMKFEERTKRVQKAILSRPDLKYIDDLNHLRFVPLNHFECTKEGMDKAFTKTTFEVDGFIFFDKHVLYEPGVTTSQCLWLKPYMLGDVFDDVEIPKKLMNEKPVDYIDFDTFVEDIRSGKEKRMDKKLKKKKKEWFPTRDLNLPPPPPQPELMQQRWRQPRKPRQWSYYGPGTERISRGRGRGSGGMVTGRGRGIREGPAAHVGPDGDRPFGKGAQTGYAYYGDDRDMYYPNQRYPDYKNDPKGRGILGKQFNDPFGMGEMEAALAYYDYGTGQRSRRPVSKKY